MLIELNATTALRACGKKPNHFKVRNLTMHNPTLTTVSYYLHNYARFNGMVIFAVEK